MPIFKTTKKEEIIVNGFLEPPVRKRLLDLDKDIVFDYDTHFEVEELKKLIAHLDNVKATHFGFCVEIDCDGFPKEISINCCVLETDEEVEDRIKKEQEEKNRIKEAREKLKVYEEKKQYERLKAKYG